jgi:hypothetical protein
LYHFTCFAPPEKNKQLIHLPIIQERFKTISRFYIPLLSKDAILTDLIIVNIYYMSGCAYHYKITAFQRTKTFKGHVKESKNIK